MVLPLRIELRTSPLPRECSTTELRQQPEAAEYVEQGRDEGAGKKRGDPCHSGILSASAPAVGGVGGGCGVRASMLDSPV